MHNLETVPDDIMNAIFAKKLYNFDRGRLFRGHQGNIVIQGKGEKGSSITFNNSYWSTHVTQQYNFGTNQTAYVIHFPAITRKWVGKLLYPDKMFFYIHGPWRIDCQWGAISFKYTVYRNGLDIMNHWDSINYIRKLTMSTRAFARKLKPYTYQKLYDEWSLHDIKDSGFNLHEDFVNMDKPFEILLRNTVD